MRPLRPGADTCAPCRDPYTAQAFITTDLDDNQITAFHPGAMSFSHQNHVADARDVGLGIIAPDGREGMLQHAREFHDAGIPFIFDPRPGPPLLDETGHPLAHDSARTFVHPREDVVQPRDVALRYLEMLLDGGLELGVVGCFGCLR